MLTEVLSRRLQRDDWPMPDFILVDGGIAQTRACQKQISKLNLKIPIAGIIKGPNRKLAKLVLTDTASAWLNKQRITLQFFEPIARTARDEAHRFAISYHRKLRRKGFFEN